MAGSKTLNHNPKDKDWKRKLLAGSMQVYAVTDRSWLLHETLYQQVEKALKGGATFIQLREKNMDDDAFLASALEIKELTDRYHVPFVINDNVDVAVRSGADGVHVGQSDMEAGDVRRLLGSDRIIGVSAHNVAEALAAEKSGADYLGVGAVFSTTTKEDVKTVSYDTLSEICAAVHIPVVAIGGITADNIVSLKGSGVSGVAVVSAIFGAEDITAATKKIYNAVGEMLGRAQDGREDMYAEGT